MLPICYQITALIAYKNLAPKHIQLSHWPLVIVSDKLFLQLLHYKMKEIVDEQTLCHLFYIYFKVQFTEQWYITP